MNRVDSFATLVSIHAVQFREKSGGEWPILNLSADDIYIYIIFMRYVISKGKIVSRLF